MVRNHTKANRILTIICIHKIYEPTFYCNIWDAKGFHKFSVKSMKHSYSFQRSRPHYTPNTCLLLPNILCHHFCRLFCYTSIIKPLLSSYSKSWVFLSAASVFFYRLLIPYTIYKLKQIGFIFLIYFKYYLDIHQNRRAWCRRSFSTYLILIAYSPDSLVLCRTR